MDGKLPTENLRKGGGRPKGVPNKTTALLKDAILKAAETAQVPAGKKGLVNYLAWLAVEHPPAFASLLGKVLPLQVTGTVIAPLMPSVIQLVGPDDDRADNAGGGMKSDGLLPR